ARALETIRDRSGSQARVVCLYNGFDPDDFAHRLPPPQSDSECYRLVYVGTLWNLTTVAPLVGAVERLCRERPDLASRLELVFAGRRTSAEDETLARLKMLPCRVRLLDYIDHAEAIDLMRSADGLCVLLADVPGAGRVVPAKIFEYMAAGRPIRAIAPDGELCDLVRNHPGTVCISPQNISAICEQLATDLCRHGSAEASKPIAAAPHGSPFSRKRQAAELASLLEGVAVPKPIPAAPERKPSWAAAGA
ncbi:MAG TPA: glycosyltransferase, partial [Pirellulales bacterium]|nr:glycosyltransferase [Pirellulales bacterium]